MKDTGRIPKSQMEWFKESAYGVVQRLPMADFNRDTFVDFFDDGDFDTAYTASSTATDINYDGVVNATDDSQWTNSSTVHHHRSPKRRSVARYIPISATRRLP